MLLLVHFFSILCFFNSKKRDFLRFCDVFHTFSRTVDCSMLSLRSNRPCCQQSWEAPSLWNVKIIQFEFLPSLEYVRRLCCQWPADKNLCHIRLSWCATLWINLGLVMIYSETGSYVVIGKLAYDTCDWYVSSLCNAWLLQSALASLSECQ